MVFADRRRLGVGPDKHAVGSREDIVQVLDADAGVGQQTAG